MSKETEQSGLARSGRRASISMPALDLLTQIAEYTWQTKPQVNSSFDDLTEAGLASKYRGSGQIGDKLKRGPDYDTIQSESEGEMEYMNRSQSDFSEIESPDPEAKVSRNRETRKVNMFVEIDKDEDAINAEIQPLKPLATRRKSGVVPIKIPNSNFLKSDPVDSNASSPTPSTASISNLLRDKFSNSIPGVFRNRKPREYRIQAFVAVLFLMIILLVGSIYVIHKEKELQKSYFERIRFSSKDRKIRVADVKGREVLTGQLGMSLTKKDKSWPCLPQHLRENHTCLEWMNKARLYFKVITPPSSSYSDRSNEHTNLKCYGVQWESLNKDFELKDCFNIGENRGGYFYGGGELATSQWPLNRTTVPMSPFLTGNKQEYDPQLSSEDLTNSFQWGRTLCRFFLNSHGAAIKIKDEVPLHVSINHLKDRMLCLAAKNGFGYDHLEASDLPELNYTICTADNILDITSHLADKEIWDGLKHEDVQLTLSLAQAPIWRILPQILLNHGNQSEAALLNHTDRIAALHLSEGFILIDESWQKRIGDLEMDSRRFPTMPETFNITRRRGFKVALTISPFFSTESQNYVQGLKEATSSPFPGNGIWTGERRNGRTTKTKVPALTQYKEWTSTAVLDVTNPDARIWLQKKVTTLVEKYGIDALYVDLGSAYDFPQHYEFTHSLPSLDTYKELFLKTIRPVTNINTIGVSGAIKLPKLPTFVALSPTESSWEGLQSIIPNILTLGVAGYPFLIPGCIGGDYFPKVKQFTASPQTDIRSADNDTIDSLTPAPIPNQTGNDQTQSSSRNTESLLPERELYIRWLELVHFLPVVQYSYLPSDYDQKVIDIATQMNYNRKNKLYLYIKKAIDAALTSGLPVIRPLWMIDPTDPNCLKVSDEFSIGGDIIVAPILRPGATERDIYLPRGKWRDEVDGSNTKGEKWLHNYRVKEEQIPFFTKIPD